MSASTPGVDSNAQAAFHRARSALAARMPVLLPANQIRSDHQFVAVSVSTVKGILRRSGELDDLQQHLYWVHVELGGHVLELAHGHQTSLGMLGSAPGA